MFNLNDEYDPDEILRDVGDQEIFDEEERQKELNEESPEKDILDDMYREDIGDLDTDHTFEE